jgi:23S rRNA pseudouridine2605 synthase
MRIAKLIASAGLCSRREAERLIEQGKVAVDGKVITSPALNIDNHNSVKVDGREIKPIPNARLWIYYKPVGLVVSHNDPEKRPTIFQKLKNKLPRVISVGRLDLNSEGLLLLTNNGGLSRYFESPQNKFERVYKVRAFGSKKEINIQNKKITIDGITYHPKSINLTKKGATNDWYEVVLTEGKNREIRKIFTHFGYEVNRLIRTKFGPYSLGNMQPGEFKEVDIDENYSWEI